MEEHNKDLQFKDVSSEELKQLASLYENILLKDGVRIGPKGYIFTKEHKKYAADIYNMKLKSGDIFVASYQRSGTTWTQELVWLVANELDYETANTIPLTHRFPFLEQVSFVFPEQERKKACESLGNTEKVRQVMDFLATPGAKLLAGMPSPRFVKTHLPMSLLPPKLMDIAKVVYVARDPRDIVVSSLYHGKLFKLVESRISNTVAFTVSYNL